MEEMKLPKSWEEACQKRAEEVKRMQQHPLSPEEFKAQCDEVMASFQPSKNSQEKPIISEQWEKDRPLREASLKYMQEHPLSSEEWDKQIKKNQEIREQNMRDMQRKERGKK